MFKKISYFTICLIATSVVAISSSSADVYRKSLVGLRYKDLPSMVKCDSRFIFELPSDGIKRTMSLTPAMVDVKESGRFTTVSVRLPFSGHMVHTIDLAEASSNKIQTGAVDEHLEITVIRHNPANQGADFVALPNETSQAGLSSIYVAGETVPNYYTSYFHEFLDVSNWNVELTCNKKPKK